MTKRRIIIGIIAAVLLFMAVEATLRDKKINELPDTAVPVEFVTFNLNRYPGEDLPAIKYNDRIYAYYGYERRPLLSWEIDECVAYNKDSTRYFTLTGTDDYIADIYMAYTVHEACFYRALDTNGEDIKTPMYIKEDRFIWGDSDEELIIWD